MSAAINNNEPYIEKTSVNMPPVALQREDTVVHCGRCVLCDVRGHRWIWNLPSQADGGIWDAGRTNHSYVCRIVARHNSVSGRRRDIWPGRPFELSRVDEVHFWFTHFITVEEYIPKCPAQPRSTNESNSP